MKLCHSSLLSKVAEDISSDSKYWTDKIKKEIGLNVSYDDVPILRQTYRILKMMPCSLIKDCGITTLSFRSDMGPNRPYYPNHGYYAQNAVTLNADIFHHPDLPDDFVDGKGYFITRPEQTLIHEFAHGFDEFQGNLSLKDNWLNLSGWSEKHRPGLKRLVIREPGVPEVVGEWFYNPKAGFTRFYAKKNPWDDWADSFAFYVAGMKDKVPENKTEYFYNILRKYYS